MDGLILLILQDPDHSWREIIEQEQRAEAAAQAAQAAKMQGRPT